MKRQITFWVILLCLMMAAMPAMTVCAAADDKPPVLTPPPTPVPVELEDMPEEEIWWTDMNPFRIGDFMPEGINVIDDYTFWGCSSLTAINIPASVSSIGEEAFWSCSSLPSINIPASVTSIAGNAFQGCGSLVIHVVSGSYAEAYCRENGMNYRVISE